MTNRSVDAMGTSRRSFLKTSVVGGMSAALLPALAGAPEAVAPAAVAAFEPDVPQAAAVPADHLVETARAGDRSSEPTISAISCMPARFVL